MRDIRLDSPQQKKQNFFGRIGTKWSWYAMAFLWTMFALNANMRTWAIGSLQPAIVNEFQVDPTAIGLFAGLITLSQGIIAIPVSHWSDKKAGWRRKSRYLPIVIGYVALSLMTGINILTVGLLGVFILQFLQKAFSGSGEALEVTAITEWWPVEKRGFAQGLHHSAYPWGTFIGGLVIAAMLGAIGSENWRVIYLTLPLLAIPVMIGYWKFSSAKNYEKFSQATVARGETVPVGHGVTEAAPKGAVKRALKNPNIVITSFVNGIALAVYTGVSFLLPLYIVFVAGFSVAETAALSVVFTLTGGVGQIVWGSVSDKMGRKLTLIILFVWLTVGLVSLQYIGISIIFLIVLQLFLGLALNGVYPVLFAMSGDSSESGAIGLAIGLNITGQMIAAAGPVTVGILVAAGGGFENPTGYVWALLIMAASMLMCALLMTFFTRETIGWFRKHDRALVSAKSCLHGPLAKMK